MGSPTDKGEIKMNTKIISVLAILLGFSIMLSGCAVITRSSQTNSTGGPSESTAAVSKPDESKEPGNTYEDISVDLMSSLEASVPLDEAGQPDKDAVDAYNRFAAELLMESAVNEGNLMISPLSVYLALAMTMNGSAGDTLDSMQRTLASESIDLEAVNETSRSLIGKLTKTGEKTTVSIANSIWFRQGFKPYLPFLQANAYYYGAGARELDFADEKASDIINSWVENETKGLIEKIIEKINPSTVMFLINTIYFKSDWQVSFEKYETRKRDFQTADGRIQSEFMHRIDKISWFEAFNATGVALPYDDGQLSFFALMPDDKSSPRQWLAKQDQAQLFNELAGQMSQPADDTVYLGLPKFEAEYEDTLNNELSVLGMEIAFDGARADFSRLREDLSKGLYISEVRHKTVIKVDEKGTEAAAATSVAVDESMPEYDKEIVFDQPFVYGIIDMTTGVPLFVGILENPVE
jgi:serpin B